MRHNHLVARFDIALVLLVNRSGAVLLQHRDSNAPASPNQWSLPGGRIEPGETPEQAARRELLEEAGLSAGELHPLWTGPRPYEKDFPHTVTVHVFRGTTDAHQEQVVLGEGQAMVFVPGKEALDRDLAVTTALILSTRLGNVLSSNHRLPADERPPGRSTRSASRRREQSEPRRPRGTRGMRSGRSPPRLPGV